VGYKTNHTHIPPTYSPPYNSPIEDFFALCYVKYAAPDIDFIPQFKVNTLCGTFIVDFALIDQSGYRIGVECDGKDFHEESRDEWRDAMILGENHIDAIYRVRGSDIQHHIEDVLFLLAELEPNLFDARAILNLSVLASLEVKELPWAHCIDQYRFHYCNDSDIGFFKLEARRRVVPATQRRFWQTAYRYALSMGGGKLDDVISSYRKRQGDSN
jgi:hypothetical protein